MCKKTKYLVKRTPQPCFSSESGLLFTHPHVIPNLYGVFTSVENKWIYLEECASCFKKYAKAQKKYYKKGSYYYLFQINSRRLLVNNDLFQDILNKFDHF